MGDEYLYHYTSVSALKSIFENKTIRLSDYRFLNDPKELALGIERILNKIDKLNCKREEIKYLKEIVNKIKNNQVFVNPPYSECVKYENFKLYILSLSENKDSLALWNNYGKDRVCLCFDKKKLIDYFTKFNDLYPPKNRITHFKVDYGNNETIESIFSDMVLNNIIFNKYSFIKGCLESNAYDLITNILLSFKESCWQ